LKGGGRGFSPWGRIFFREQFFLVFLRGATKYFFQI